MLLHDAIDPAGDSWERKGGLSVHERCCGLGSRRRGQGLLNDTLEHEDRGGVAARISTRCRIAHASGVAKALPKAAPPTDSSKLIIGGKLEGEEEAAGCC